MRVLAAVHALIAAALLLLGLVTTFSIGITGLFMLLPAALFATIAGAVATGSRAAVLLALMLDAVLAAFAANKLLVAEAADMIVPGLTLAFVCIAVTAVLLDWRNLMARRWFEGEGPRGG